MQWLEKYLLERGYSEKMVRNDILWARARCTFRESQQSGEAEQNDF